MEVEFESTDKNIERCWAKLGDRFFDTDTIQSFPRRSFRFKRTVVFDLDHTLVETVVGENGSFVMHIRTEMIEVVKRLTKSRVTEVILWTNGRVDYAAQAVVALEETFGKLFDFVVARSIRNFLTTEFYSKNLTNIKRTETSVLVDDSFHSTRTHILCSKFNWKKVNEEEEKREAKFVLDTIFLLL